jgi:Lrp/AsnC family transcriptional regulator, regulator for asnA, asnC and gidA
MMAMEKLDKLDRQILAALSGDGRRPYREIARQLKVSEGTVRQRMGRLLERGLIRIAAVGSPLDLGFEAVALVLIQVRPGSAEEVARRLSEIPHIRFVGTTLGSADISIQTIHPTLQDLYGFVSNGLPELSPDIIRTETFQLTQVLKSAWTWEEWWQ